MEPSASAETTSAPTTVPQPTLMGEFPGPNATVPPGAPVLSDLKLDDLATLWASLGLPCLSHTSGGPTSPASYNVHCEGADPAADVEVVADAAYWTFDGVATMSIGVHPTSDGSIDAAAAASDWVVPFAHLAAGDAAVAWVRSHIADSACADGCTKVFRGAVLAYYTGTRGGGTLHYVAPVPVRSR
jgi:hypothetical protein